MNWIEPAKCGNGDARAAERQIGQQRIENSGGVLPPKPGSRDSH